MQECKYASMSLCHNESIKVCMYASMYNVYIKYWANIQVSKFESKQECMYANMQVFEYTNLKVCMYACMKVYK